MVDKLEILRNNEKFFVDDPGIKERFNSELDKQTDILLQEERGGWRNLVIERENVQIPFHRQVDPFGEISSSAEEIAEVDVFICIGTGFGYHLLNLLPIIPSSVKVLLIEPVFEALVLFMTEQDLSNFLTDNVEIAYAPEPDIALEILKKRFPRYRTLKLRMVQLESMSRLEGHYSKALAESIKHASDRQLVFLRSMQEQHQQIFDHTLANMDFSAVCEIPKAGFGKGSRVIIAGSGPSLEYNSALLPEVANSALVIAAGSALNSLLHYGIEPDIVLVGDPKSLNVLHFPEENYHIDLFFDPVVSPEIIKRFSRRHFIVSAGHKLTNILMSHWDIPRLECWGTVSSMAIALAEFADFDEIVLIGTDFSFSGHQIHAEKYKLVTSNIKVIESLDVNRAKVNTTDNLQSYAKYVDGQISTLVSRGAKIINCCEGGLLEAGERITLRELYHSTMRNPPPKPELLAGDSLKPTSDDFTQIAEHLGAIQSSVKKDLSMVMFGRLPFTDFMESGLVSALEGGFQNEARILEDAIIDGNDEDKEYAAESFLKAFKTRTQLIKDRLAELIVQTDKTSRQ